MRCRKRQPKRRNIWPKLVLTCENTTRNSEGETVTTSTNKDALSPRTIRWPNKIQMEELVISSYGATARFTSSWLCIYASRPPQPAGQAFTPPTGHQMEITGRDSLTCFFPGQSGHVRTAGQRVFGVVFSMITRKYRKCMICMQF